MFISKKYLKITNALFLATTLFSCTNNLNQTIPSIDNKVSSTTPLKNNFKFGVKFANSFNPEAYRLAWADIRTAIKNKSIPDVVYHYTYSLTYEPNRVNDSNYLQIKQRLEDKTWSEEAYLIAYPDVKLAVDNGTIPSGYSHWYNHASTAENGRLTNLAYLNAKQATDAGFSELAYRTRWADVDNAIRNNTLPSAYAHYRNISTSEKNTRVTDPMYIKIKQALDYGFNEQAYRLAYPDVNSAIVSGSLPNALRHCIDIGFTEGRLETLIYQDAKLALMLDFDETRYRTAFPDVTNAVNNGVYPSAFKHYSMYGKHEGRLTRQVYLNTKLSNQVDTIINTYTTNIQSSSSVAINNSGSFVVAWRSTNTDDTDGGIYLRRYNSDGIAQGSEFKVNDYTTGNQHNPKVAIDDSGSFVVSWTSSHDGDLTGVYAKKYNSSGTVQVSEFRVNDYTTNNQNENSVSMDSVGNFIISWQSGGDSGSVQDGSYGFSVYAKKYNSSGTVQVSEFRVNNHTTGYQRRPSVSMNSTGDFVITWDGRGASADGIYAKRYNSNGTVAQSDFLVSNSGLFYENNSSVAINDSGDFIISWKTDDPSTRDYDVAARRYNSNGTAQSSVFKVNEYTTGAQYQTKTEIDNSGNFIVAWTTTGVDGSGYSVSAQRYNNTSVKQGSNFQVNSYTTSIQFINSISMNSSGNFIITWDGAGLEDSSGIYAKRYLS